jgi:hypothetical protein
MKTKLAILLLSAVALVSFTAVSSNKNEPSVKQNQHKNYQSGGGQSMTDKSQFN